ncbi:hypothetical protein CQW23_22200 [Capsicum baccatum]|uniref:Protein kinase domain-containing protein n=1 Tax=Capsicum baccatum TaxID=33114 RepID=A0A2G2W064_CAPBA|nr:hypothetical protein CQW23_22200 [Capsicum baccatum]
MSSLQEMYARMSKYDLRTKCSECLNIKRLKQKKRRHKKSSSLKGVDPKFLKNQRFARKGTPFSGQWSLKEDFAVLEKTEGDTVTKIDWDFNPCTTVTLTRILLVGTPIHKEFIKYPNLLAYAVRFFVKFVKNKDVVDLSSRRGSYDFVETLIKQSDRIGVRGFCNVYLCKFPQRNLFDLPAGTYVVKSLTALGAHTYFVMVRKYICKTCNMILPQSVFGYGEDGVRQYLIMQYGGGTLTQRIGELQYSEVMTILIDVCNALHAIHSHATDRLLHDDLAPRNITKGGRAKLIDFGMMSYVGCDKQNTNSIYRERKWDKYKGTKPVTDKATQSRDIFSFGIIMIEMLTNEDLGGVTTDMESVLNLKLKCEVKVPYLTIIRENIQQSGCNEDRARELVDLALLCIRRDRELYPRAHEVSSKLMTIRDIV